MKKILFCGFGKLGSSCLKVLIENGYEIGYILTHKENEQDSVDTFAFNNKIEYSYLDARKHLTQLIEEIEKFDLLISVNYRYVIPKEIYTLADIAINVHGSLLPKYRGRTPHVWSIINGEKESGITCHIIEETVDTGAIVSQIVVPIEKDDTGYSLLKKFEGNYPLLLMDSINKLENRVALSKQDEELASYYGKRTPDMGYIDFRKSATEIIDFVRAQAEPYPGAYYYLVDGRKIIINKLVRGEQNQLDMTIGVIKEINSEYFVLCKDGVLKIQDYHIV